MIRRVEEPLTRSLLDAVLRQMPAAVLIAEAPGGRVIAFNDQVEKILRRPAGEWTIDAYASVLTRALHHGEPVEGEDVRIMRGDGTQGVIRVSAAPILDEGRIIAGVITFFDVTDQVREQNSLIFLAAASAIVGEIRETGDTLRRIAQLSISTFADLAFVYLLEPDGSIRRQEVAAADPERKTLLDSLTSRFELPAILHNVLRTGQSQIRARILDDDLRTVLSEPQRAITHRLGIRSAMTVAIGTAPPNLYGLMIFARTREGDPYDDFDLMLAEEIARRAASAIERSRLFDAEREQRQIAESAARRVEHLQSLSSALATAMSLDDVCDVTIREVTRVAPARRVLLGLRRDDHIEIVRTEGYAREDVEPFRRIPLDSDWPLVRAVVEDQPLWLRNRDEAVAHTPAMADVIPPVGAWAVLPLEFHGRALGVLGFSFTESQPFIEDDRKFLLSIAGQCAIALERARLFESERTAREDAERASRAKDEFLAILSHELRTPMTTVIGWADFLRMTRGEDPDLAGPIDALRNSARVQAKLVDDLLDVSRIVAGKLPLNMIQTELNGIVHSTLTAVRMAAEEKGVELVEALSAKPLALEGDPDRLAQIVSNLVVNAIKFTPRGGRVTVTTADRGDHVELDVADTGEGISPDFLPHVFDRFRQASVGDSRRHSGLGLGLSIVQHLVQRHGGTVTAASDGLGKGAKFMVCLPKQS